MRERLNAIQEVVVAPRRGAWIETWKGIPLVENISVAPRRGAWIETMKNVKRKWSRFSRTPQGCVD